MATKKGEGKGAPTKRTIRDVSSTPGKIGVSPMRKQPKPAVEEPNCDLANPSVSLKSEIMDAFNAVLDSKLDQLAARSECMMTAKIQELEQKFKNIQSEVKKLKEEVDDSISHVEYVLKQDNDCVWEYAVKNEQYSRKNNLRIHGLEEEEGENLEQKFVQFIQDNLQEEIQPAEIEIIHRIGQKKDSTNGDQGSRHDGKRPVIVKLLSNKSKMKILLKRKLLKGKGVVIMEDMADDLAKRLKELKKKKSVESTWFTNGKVKYKQHGDPRVKEIRGWYDLGNIE